MPVLNAEEGKLLMEVANPEVRTIGRTRLMEVLAICEKLHNGVQEFEERAQAAEFLLQAFYLTSIGKITHDDIDAHPRLNPTHREDLHHVRTMYEQTHGEPVEAATEAPEIIIHSNP